MPGAWVRHDSKGGGEDWWDEEHLVSLILVLTTPVIVLLQDFSSSLCIFFIFSLTGGGCWPCPTIQLLYTEYSSGRDNVGRPPRQIYWPLTTQCIQDVNGECKTLTGQEAGWHKVFNQPCVTVPSNISPLYVVLGSPTVAPWRVEVLLKLAG